MDKMETGWAQSMTFGFGFGVFKRRMLNRGRCITGMMWKWNFVRSCWCCCLRRSGGLDAETKRSSSTNWRHILSWIHSQTASLLELDDNPHLTTSTQHVMVGITRSKVIFSYAIHTLSLSLLYIYTYLWHKHILERWMYFCSISLGRDEPIHVGLHLVFGCVPS